MTMPDTITTLAEGQEEKVTVRYLSPPQYIKAANAREHRGKHAEDLHKFLVWAQNSAGLLREIPQDKLDALVEDYLDEVEPKDV